MVCDDEKDGSFFLGRGNGGWVGGSGEIKGERRRGDGRRDGAWHSPARAQATERSHVSFRTNLSIVDNVNIALIF